MCNYKVFAPVSPNSWVGFVLFYILFLSISSETPVEPVKCNENLDVKNNISSCWASTVIILITPSGSPNMLKVP